MSYYNRYPEKAICLDVETTGIDPCTAEILQLSIIDYNGNTLFNEYIKPDKALLWPGAEKVHHISPLKVMNKPHLSFFKERLKKIFNNAELIISYNGNHYDIPLIARYGFPELFHKKSYDVMLKFAPIYGAWDDYHQSYTWQKLNVCADYYGYHSSGGSFHDSLEDIRATLFCYKKMVDDDDEEDDDEYDNEYYDNGDEDEDIYDNEYYVDDDEDDIYNNGYYDNEDAENEPYTDEYLNSIIEEAEENNNDIPTIYKNHSDYDLLAQSIHNLIHEFRNCYIRENYTQNIYYDCNRDFLKETENNLDNYLRILLIYSILLSIQYEKHRGREIVAAFRPYYDEDDIVCNSYTLHTTREQEEFYDNYNAEEDPEGNEEWEFEHSHKTTCGEAIDKFWDDSEDFLKQTPSYRDCVDYPDIIKSRIQSFFHGNYKALQEPYEDDLLKKELSQEELDKLSDELNSLPF